MRFSRECGLCHMCASCLLDIMRNKLEWVGAGTSTTEKRPPAIAGVDGIDSQRVCDVASGVLRRLCNRVPRGQDCRRAGPQATERWRTQRAAADDGAETAVYLGLSEGLSVAGSAGRGLWAEPVACESVDPAVAADSEAGVG